MTYYIINGSPRNNYNTKKLLEKSIEGISIKKYAEIEENGLFNLNYTGCRECFSCKIKKINDKLINFEETRHDVLYSKMSRNSV